MDSGLNPREYMKSLTQCTNIWVFRRLSSVSVCSQHACSFIYEYWNYYIICDINCSTVYLMRCRPLMWCACVLVWLIFLIYERLGWSLFPLKQRFWKDVFNQIAINWFFFICVQAHILSTRTRKCLISFSLVFCCFVLVCFFIREKCKYRRRNQPAYFLLNIVTHRDHIYSFGFWFHSCWFFAINHVMCHRTTTTTAHAFERSDLLFDQCGGHLPLCAPSDIYRMKCITIIKCRNPKYGTESHNIRTRKREWSSTHACGGIFANGNDVKIKRPNNIDEHEMSL